MTEKELMQLIDEAAKDETVKNDASLFDSLTKAYKDLDNGKTVKEVSLSLSQNLSMYLMTHKYKAPQVIVELIKAMKNDSNSFWKGTGISQLFW